MANLNIVIVTYNWPPRNAIGTHRPYAWARYWSEAGARVTILTARKQAFDEPLDLELPALNNVNVIEVASISAWGFLGSAFRFHRVRQLARRLVNALKSRRGWGVDPRLSWRDASAPIARDLATKADVVVSTFGPAASHLIGFDMKSVNPDLLWVADYRDLWSQNHALDVPDAVRSVIQKIELETVGAAADLLTAVSLDMVEKLTQLTKIETKLIPNGFDVDEEVVKASLAGIHRDRPINVPLRIVYTGMIYEGHRDPTPLLNALARLLQAGRISRGQVTVDFYGGRVDLAERLARNELFAPFIRLMGHVNREQALDAQRSAGLLLLLESSAVEARGVLTGKLFEYIAAGKPILCIGSRPEFEIGNVLSKTCTGRVFGPDQCLELEEVLLATLAGHGLYAEYSPVFDEIIKYSRKRQSQVLLEILVEKAKAGRCELFTGSDE